MQILFYYTQTENAVLSKVHPSIRYKLILKSFTILSVRLFQVFAQWEGMEVRLDIWHFMRRVAAVSHTLSMGHLCPNCPSAYLSGMKVTLNS